MSGCKKRYGARPAIFFLLSAVSTSPAAAQAVLPIEAQLAVPAREYAVIGRETIPIPLLSIGGNQASVSQSGQSNTLNLDQQGRSTATTHQTGFSNSASVTMRADQGTLSLVQSGSGNMSTVATNGPNTVDVQQIGDNNRSDIKLFSQGATVTSQQVGSGMSNAISQGGVGKAVTVVQSR